MDYTIRRTYSITSSSRERQKDNRTNTFPSCLSEKRDIASYSGLQSMEKRRKMDSYSHENKALVFPTSRPEPRCHNRGGDVARGRGGGGGQEGKGREIPNTLLRRTHERRTTINSLRCDHGRAAARGRRTMATTTPTRKRSDARNCKIHLGVRSRITSQYQSDP